MANINRVKTDLVKEVDGTWVDFILGIRLKIARSRNAKYNEMIRNLTENMRIDMRDGKFDTEGFNEVLVQVRAHTILLDWENVDEDGVEIPYSPEKAMQYFRDPELKDFYTFVVAISESAEAYKKDLVKESEKNLPSS